MAGGCDTATGCYWQKLFGVQTLVVGGEGQSAAVVQAFVQLMTCMTFWQSL